NPPPLPKGRPSNPNPRPNRPGDSPAEGGAPSPFDKRFQTYKVTFLFLRAIRALPLSPRLPYAPQEHACQRKGGFSGIRVEIRGPAESGSAQPFRKRGEKRGPQGQDDGPGFRSGFSLRTPRQGESGGHPLRDENRQHPRPDRAQPGGGAGNASGG